MAEAETATATGSEDGGTPSPDRLLEVALFFLKIGLVGFGGPLVHIAMMEDELVGQGSREWTDERTFVEGLAICNTLPGPASTQLGIFMGWVRAGTPGALVAGTAFMLPTFLVVLALSYLYFAYGGLPAVGALFYGINPVVIGLIVGATYSMAHTALAEGDDDLRFAFGGRDWAVDLKLLALLVAALVATAALNPNPLLLFVVAGLVGVGIYRPDWVRANAGRLAVGFATVGVLAIAYDRRDAVAAALAGLGRTLGVTGALGGLAGALWANTWVKLFLFMVYTGSFIYGGGLVLVPFIEKYVVSEFGWMTGATFVDGIAIGQLTPGPVVMTTAFVGYELMYETYGGSVAWGALGALVAAVGAFLPSFVFVVGLFPYVARIREDDRIRVALTGVNAAVVGAILGATVPLAAEALFAPEGTPFPDLAVDPVAAALVALSTVLFARGVSAVRLIALGGAVGLATLLA
ncbi:chromate efflux transporter [Halomarina pelagica]|uniref:chromate efflux transporter n=1 Tax=Halomarina pelagica TaxID=2961599 RepID=UPI0020C551EB|nr:chromate efflux transporter [Halomarina sp. BND7]